MTQSRSRHEVGAAIIFSEKTTPVFTVGAT
jgi:hypothetical protein